MSHETRVDLCLPNHVPTVPEHTNASCLVFASSHALTATIYNCPVSLDPLVEDSASCSATGQDHVMTLTSEILFFHDGTLFVLFPYFICSQCHLVMANGMDSHSSLHYSILCSIMLSVCTDSKDVVEIGPWFLKRRHSGWLDRKLPRNVTLSNEILMNLYFTCLIVIRHLSCLLFTSSIANYHCQHFCLQLPTTPFHLCLLPLPTVIEGSLLIEFTTTIVDKLPYQIWISMETYMERRCRILPTLCDGSKG